MVSRGIAIGEGVVLGMLGKIAHHRGGGELNPVKDPLLFILVL